MKDLQQETDQREITLDHAGIKEFTYPLSLLVSQKHQETLGKFSCSTRLESQERGTHMSRFIALITEKDPKPVLSLSNLSLWHQELLNTQQAQEGTFEVQSTVFLEKVAPSSGKKSYLDYQITLKASGRKDACSKQVQLIVPCTSCCPCSKAISQYGAHNQRSTITLTFDVLEQKPNQCLISEIIRLTESCASSELYPLIKREDEKFVTEKAYENAKFAEDMARDVALSLKPLLGQIDNCHIEIENFESIHNHNAFSSLTLKKS